MGFTILWARPAFKAAICEWIYRRKVVPVHRPTFIIVSASAPLSFMAIAPDARSEWEPTRSILYPWAVMPVAWTAARTVATMSLDKTCKPGEIQLKGVAASHPCETISCTRRARAFTGQNHPATAVWCMVAPFCPFF